MSLDAENEKAADPARDVRGADQSEYIGDRVGKCVEVGHRAAVRRDKTARPLAEIRSFFYRSGP